MHRLKKSKLCLRSASRLRPLLVGVLAIAFLACPIAADPFTGHFKVSSAWADSSKDNSDNGNGNKNGHGNGTSSGNGGDMPSSGNGDSTNSDGTTGSIRTDATARPDIDAHPDSSASVELITRYKKVALAAARADQAVVEARQQARAAQARLNIADEAMRQRQGKLEAARLTAEQTAIAAAMAAAEVSAKERKAAASALNNARGALLVATRQAKSARAAVAKALDAVANKDLTDRLAETLNGMLGLKQPL